MGHISKPILAFVYVIPEANTDLTGKDLLNLEEELKDFRTKYGQPSQNTDPSNK